MLATNQTGQPVNNSTRLATATHDTGKLNDLLESIREFKGSLGKNDYLCHKEAPQKWGAF